MRRRISLGIVALITGLASPSPGQFGGMGGGMGGGRGGTVLDFGNAGADSPRGAQVLPVKIVAADGKTTTGALRLTTAVISCPFGFYEIKPEKVQEIRFNNRSNTGAPVVVGPTGLQRSGQIVTVAGDVIEGVILLPSWWRIETELGVLAPNSEGLKSISFLKETAGSLTTPPESIPPPGRRTSQPPPDQPVSIPLPGSSPDRPTLPPA